MLLVFYIFLFLLAKPICANEILLNDNFNDNNFNDWTVVRNMQWHHPERPCFNKGYPTKWEIKNGELGITIDGSPCTTEIIPQNLDLTEVNNYEFEFDWNFLESPHMDRNLLIKWQDEHNWYGLHLMDNKILLQKVVNGRLESLYDNWGYYQFETDQRYHFKISVINDLITTWIDDNQIFQTLDRPPFLTGYKTLGFQASSGNIFRSVSFFDNLIVSSLDITGEKKLNVSLYKQHDLTWKNQEYDRARDWAKKYTLQRWGCALTSATMILDYYGINKLPSGRNLDPSKLNAWLKNQPDGYIGQGLINWLAVSRLSQLMNQELGTPVLEYQWLAGNIKTAIAEIDQEQPAILQTPGHFLVASGYTADKTDLYIKDPAYSYDLFSQHKSEIQSIRAYRPSHTDLSYLLLVYDPETKLTLIDESDQIPADLNIYTEYISEYIQDSLDNLEGQSEISMIQSLAKPTTGKYLVKIENESEESKKVEIYSYDNLGQVTILSQEVSGTKLFYLNFNKSEESQLTEITNQFTLLRDLLKTLYESGKITTKYAYVKLDQLAKYAQKDELNQDRYQKLIIKTAQELGEFVPYLTVMRSLAPSS
ncbi:C39 family peptidase [Patescibacteria group bacterium]|nr:C39 family peptidase [Patescibacteria group bacterium]MBU1885078.1 C39 family peptidase [Patescibacteria group bacterium]